MTVAKKSLIFSLFLLALSVLFVLALIFSRAGVVFSPSPAIACGPCSTSADCICAEETPDFYLGFPNVNLAVFRTLGGFHILPYKISKYSGLLVFLIPLALFVLSLLSLKHQKSQLRLFLPLLGLYALTALTYLIFELFPLNFRPVDLGEGLESSFPSSHTLFSVAICVSAALFLEKYKKFPKSFAPVKENLPFTKIALYLLAALVVLSRFFSGVHWFTDILGGLLFSVTLLSFFNTALLVALNPAKTSTGPKNPS